jgi:hypothetical protein
MRNGCKIELKKPSILNMMIRNPQRKKAFKFSGGRIDFLFSIMKPTECMETEIMLGKKTDESHH